MKVKFIPQNVEFEIEPDQSVMNLAHQHGLPVKSVCNGMPSCAECRVKVVEGDYNVLPPSSKELSLIGTGYFIDQRRLACQLVCFGDVTIDLTEQVERAKEGPSTKKLGSKQKESTEESYAVGGNLIEQDEDLVKEVTEVPPPRAAKGPTVAQKENENFYGNLFEEKERGKGKPGSGKRRGRGRGRGRGKKSAAASESGGGGGAQRKKKPRNRRRPRRNNPNSSKS